jgi:hypothetical protein
MKQQLEDELEKMLERWLRKIAAHQASKDPEIVGRRLGFAEAATELKAILYNRGKADNMSGPVGQKA